MGGKKPGTTWHREWAHAEASTFDEKYCYIRMIPRIGRAVGEQRAASRAYILLSAIILEIFRFRFGIEKKTNPLSFHNQPNVHDTADIKLRTRWRLKPLSHHQHHHAWPPPSRPRSRAHIQIHHALLPEPTHTPPPIPIHHRQPTSIPTRPPSFPGRRRP